MIVGLLCNRQSSIIMENYPPKYKSTQIVTPNAISTPDLISI